MSIVYVMITCSLAILLFLHWVGDFVLQTKEMAENKSKSIKWLTIHCFVYSLPLLLVGWKFALINGACHWVIDFVTSKFTAKYFKEKQTKKFWLVIGFDQYLHTIILIATYFSGKFAW